MPAASPERRATVDRRRINALRRRLLEWYHAHRRDLPWRATRTHAKACSASRSGTLKRAQSPHPSPYHVLVSEAMLQQTQVATVIPYFQRFIEAFPTAADLAGADEQRVLRLWQGLGYYRRARHLHAAAKIIVERFGGVVPRSVEELLTLPGVGRYTAGAVASIAYGEPAPILDGNVARVLARWFAIEQCIDDPRTRKYLWEVAEHMVEGERPGDLNQAMMELGALVCTPTNPDCGTCPVTGLCEARKADVVRSIPMRAKARAKQAITHQVIGVHRGGRFLFEQRPAKGLWSNMWQLTTLETEDGADKGGCAAPAKLVSWVRERYGLSIASLREVGRFPHVTTHRDITFIVYMAEVAAGRLRPHRGQWRKLGEVDELPLPNPQRKVLKLLVHLSH